MHARRCEGAANARARDPGEKFTRLNARRTDCVVITKFVLSLACARISRGA